MKKMIYSVYYVDTQKNDINFIEDYEDTESIATAYGLTNIKSIYNYLVDNADINFLELKHKMQDKYIIIKDYLDSDEVGVY